MLSDNNEDNYTLFFKDSIETGCIWGLQADEGWAQCASEKYDESPVMPLWSQPEYAEVHRQDEWAAYTVVPISLEEFLEDWLPGMHDDVVLVGVNWNDSLEGEEYEPLDLLHEFEKIIGNTRG